jgi:hypothetical protein
MGGKVAWREKAKYPSGSHHPTPADKESFPAPEKHADEKHRDGREGQKKIDNSEEHAAPGPADYSTAQ